MSLRLHHDADPSDPEWMTPERRRDEIAGVFSRGDAAQQRLHMRRLLAADEIRLPEPVEKLELLAGVMGSGFRSRHASRDPDAKRW